MESVAMHLASLVSICSFVHLPKILTVLKDSQVITSGLFSPLFGESRS